MGGRREEAHSNTVQDEIGGFGRRGGNQISRGTGAGEGSCDEWRERDRDRGQGGHCGGQVRGRP